MHYDVEMQVAIIPLLGEFPDQQNDVWKLVMPVYRYDSFTHAFDKSLMRPKFPISPVVEVAQVMRKYLSGVSSNFPDAQFKYEEYVRTTEIVVQERSKHAELCSNWTRDIYMQCSVDFYNSLRDFSNIAGNILQKKGYAMREPCFFDAPYTLSGTQ